jgi:TP901 family phage tail tape measure protein
VTADTSQAESGIANFGSKIGGLSTAVLGGTAIIGTALAGVGIAGVKMAADLQQSVANISTIKPDIDTSAVFNSLSEISTRVPQSAQSLANGLYNIFSSINVSQADALKLVEQFGKGATAAQTDANTFGTAVIGVMNAYGQSVTDAAHDSDVFFNTVNAGVVNGQELASNLGLVTQSAKGAGVSFDELGALIVGVTKEGGPAAQNINNLSNLLLKIHTPQAAAGFKALGIATQDASGNFRSVIDVMGDMQSTLATMTEAERNAYIQKIFPDIQAQTAARTLMGELDSVRAALKTNTEQAGSTEAAYAKMSATASAQFQLLKNTGVRVLTQLGAAILPAITPILVAFNTQLPGAIKAFQAATEGAGGGGGLTKLQTLAYGLGKAFQFVRDGVKTFAQALSGNWTAAPGIVGFHALLGNLGNLIRTVIIPAFQQFVGWIQQVAAAFQSGGLGAGIQKILADLAGFAGQVGAALLVVGQKFVEWIAPMIPPMLEKLGELGKRLIGWIGERIPEVLAQLQVWGQQFVDWIAPQIPPMLAKLAEVGHALVQWLGEQVPVVLAKLLEWGQKFLEWIEPQIAPMIAKAGELAGQFFAWIDSQLPTIIAKLTEWGNEFVNWIETTVIPQLPGKLLEIWTAINGFIAQVLVDVVPELAKLAVKFSDWIESDAIPGLKAALPGILTTILGWITGIQGAVLQEAASIGVSIIQGVVNGVESMAGSLASSAVGVVKGALGAAKSALGIGSPSKVMAAEVGDPMVQGIISGILAAHPELMATMDVVTQMAVEKANQIVAAAAIAQQGAASMLKLGNGTSDAKAVAGMMAQLNQLKNSVVTTKAADAKAVTGMMAQFNAMFNPPKLGNGTSDAKAVTGMMAQFNALAKPVTVNIHPGAVQVHTQPGQDTKAIVAQVIDQLGSVFMISGRESGLSM